jgi:cellobiose-specific phosphotransferase system component IIC
MGIAQGYILIPLILFVAIQRYRMEFLMRGKFRTIQLFMFWQHHFRMYFMLIGGVGIALGLALILVLPELVYVLAAIASTTLYTLYFKAD